MNPKIDGCITFINKLNSLNQHYQGKYKWWHTLLKYISKNLKKIIKEREEFLGKYCIMSMKSHSAGSSRKRDWKGIETTPGNLNKFRFLKEELKKRDHPLTQLVGQFHKWMESSYESLLYPNWSEINNEKLRDEIIDEVKRFIVLLFFTIIKFYNLSFKDNENNCDILLEIITGIVVKGELYLAIHNAISIWLKSQIETLDTIMQEEEHVNLDDSKFMAGVPGIFSFDESLRKMKIGKSGYSPEIANQETNTDAQMEVRKSKYKKWSLMIRRLKNIQNPTSKIHLEKITNQIKHDIDDFWEGVEIHQDDKWIDADNMEKILAYVIIKSKYQKIVVDLAMIDHFAGNHIDFGWSGFIFVWISNSLQKILEDNKEQNKQPFDRKTPVFKGLNQGAQLDSFKANQFEESGGKSEAERGRVLLKLDDKSLSQSS